MSAATATRSTVDGELTIKGITRPVELTGTIADPIVDAYGNERVGLALETTVDRTAVRPQLERPAPERQAGARERRELTAELYLVKA